MERYLIWDDTLVDIADAIRDKTGGEESIPVPEMAARIASIKTFSDPVLEGVTITPTGEEIVKIPPNGVDGFGIVTVTGEQNLIPENVKEGVTIYGVEGTHSNGLDTSDATATAEDILEGASAYVDGEKIIGTHVCAGEPILSTAYASPTGIEFTIVPEDGVDGFSEVIVDGDDNLVPENIKKGVVIYGVEGSLGASSEEEEEEEDPTKLQVKEVTPGVADQNVVADEDFYALSRVKVKGDENLKPENIVEGTTIFGVIGTAKIGTDTPVSPNDGLIFTLNTIHELREGVWG